MHYFRWLAADQQATVILIGLQNGFQLLGQGQSWISLAHPSADVQADIGFIAEVLDDVYDESLGSIVNITEVLDRDSSREWLKWESDGDEDRTMD